MRKTSIFTTFALLIGLMAPVRFPALAQTAGAAVDPCASTTPKNSAPFTITTATTTSIVAVSGTTQVFVCGFVVSMTGTTTANTIVLEYGTGATCGGGTTALTGTMSSGILTTGGTVIVYNEPLKPTPAANGVCILSTVGTGPSISGVLTFVQQ